MGCGCGRGGKKNKGVTTFVVHRKAVPTKTTTLSIMDLNDRKEKCSICPFSTRKNISGRCKKANRLVSRFINEINFHCPIKRF